MPAIGVLIWFLLKLCIVYLSVSCICRAEQLYLSSLKLTLNISLLNLESTWDMMMRCGVVVEYSDCVPDDCRNNGLRSSREGLFPWWYFREHLVNFSLVFNFHFCNVYTFRLRPSCVMGSSIFRRTKNWPLGVNFLENWNVISPEINSTGFH